MRRALSLRAAALRVPNPYPATAWRRGCRGAAAHRYSSAVRSPSCEGTLPLRPLLRRSLREGRRSRKKGGGTSMADPRRVADARHAPPLRDAALCPFPAPPSQPWQPSCDPLRSPTFVGGTRQAGQRSAQSGAAVSAVAGRRLAGANGASGVATPQPRRQHQQQRGATHAARQAVVGGARKATAGSAPRGAHPARATGLATM